MFFLADVEGVVFRRDSAGKLIQLEGAADSVRMPPAQAAGY